MPVLAVKAASTSSSAFFIEAAANTVRLLSCAVAGEAADPNRTVKHRKIPARRCIGSAPGVFTALRARKSGVGWVWLRQAEAPFRQSLRTYGPSGYRWLK